MSLPSCMADFVPCDRLLQKAHWASENESYLPGRKLYFSRTMERNFFRALLDSSHHKNVQKNVLMIRLPSSLICLVPTFSIIIQVSPSCVRPLLNTSGIPSVTTANTSLFQSLSSTFLASLSLSSSWLVQYRGTHLFKFKRATSRCAHLEKFSLNVSSS